MILIPDIHTRFGRVFKRSFKQVRVMPFYITHTKRWRAHTYTHTPLMCTDIVYAHTGMHIYTYVYMYIYAKYAHLRHTLTDTSMHTCAHAVTSHTYIHAHILSACQTSPLQGMLADGNFYLQ